MTFILTDLNDETEVVEPASVLQGGVPLAALVGETECAEAVVTLPHCMDVGNVQMSQFRPWVVGHILRPFTL